jgi:hypothetical protein
MNRSKSHKSPDSAHISPNRITWRQNLIWTTVILAFIYGLYQAVSLAWISDDAFISFRCAQNLINGNGLVYNIGERVEAYTNFLWTLIIAGGMFIGLEPMLFSKVLSITCFILTALSLFYLTLKLHKEQTGRTLFIIPLAAVAFLLQYDTQSFATSGLETSCTAFLVTAGFISLVLARSARPVILSGFFLTLAVACRPDCLIFYSMALIYLSLQRPGRRINLISFLIPFVVLYIPYWIARYMYYGFPFPNAFYAKSASTPYFSQGASYVWLYFKTYYILFLIPLTLLAALPHYIKKLSHRELLKTLDGRIWFLSLLFAIPFILYVARVGGDFMFARFLIPVIPICLILLEINLTRLIRNDYLKLAIFLIIAAAIIFRSNQFPTAVTNINGIVDERQNYPPEKIIQAKAEAAKLKKYLIDKNVKVAFYGAKAMLIYYSELPWALECAAGLTDSYIAHLPIEKRGRPGHEKRIPYDYLVNKGINFVVGGSLRPSPDNLEMISFDGSPEHIITYQNRVMDPLKKYPEIKFIDFPAYLDNYIRRIDSIPTDRLRQDLDYFGSFYFAHNNDPRRYNLFLAKLQ